MNRIILIGNGFDLVHNLKTSYKDFIDDFGVNVANQVSSHQGTLTENGRVLKLNNMTINHALSSGIYLHRIRSAEGFFNAKKNAQISIKITNKFLETISALFIIEKWVDIEELYYKQLKKLSLDTELPRAAAIRKLNNDFTEVGNLLCEYLNEKLPSTTQNIVSIQNICNKHLGIKVKELSIQYNREVKEILKQCFEQERDYGNTEMVQLIRSTKILNPSKVPDITESCDNYTYKNFDFEKIVADFDIKHKIQSTLFLNFNYTNTPQQYAGIGDQIINIHGTLNDDDNPVIFGYGDEAGEDYAKLENTNIDEVLKKIKSQHYLLNGNNRELMNFMESDHYQVVVLGHSCGNSDRTLLKALFEHENCVSIKPYYYTNEQGIDNYGDITRAISRNFRNCLNLFSYLFY